MDLSEEWKSLFPIGSVFDAPLLLSSPTSKSILGPLFFNPNRKTLTQLYKSPSLFPPLLNPPPRLSLSRFLTTSTTFDSPIPLSTASSITSRLGSQFHDNSASLLAHNQLQFLNCPHDNSVIVFFSTGCNHDQVGFLLLSVNDKRLCAVGDSRGGVFVANKCLNQRIVKILVNPVVDSGYFEGNASSKIVGYLLVYTLFSVHWFCVKIGEINERPILGHVGCKTFKSCSIVDACWSPHLIEESVVLLENGGLFLFDLNSDSSNAYFRGTKLKVLWDDLGKSKNFKWLGCQFSWHPRILIVASSDAVFLVDWRYDEFKVTCLANIDMFGVYAPVENERFLTFSMAVSDHFQFVLASENMLALCDVRKPLMPVLQWAHALDRPCYIDVFRLSELRSNSRNSIHEWATTSGFGIILGSFWNCEFSLFCYGPPLPGQQGSIASEISKISKSAYAWELPSDLLLSGEECQCGSCLVKEEFLKDALPDWIDWQQKKDIVLGFGILSKDLSSLLFESDEFGGFTLIRLMSSGKLESQRYHASWDLVRKSEQAHRDPLLCSEDNLLFSLGEEEYKFPRKFKYLKLEYLFAYINGNLSQVLDLNLIKTCKGPREKESFSMDFHEILCEKLKMCGFSQFRTSPAISVVFNNIDLPTSIHEVALRSIWASLPMEFLQLAFSSYSEFLEVLLDQKKVALDFLVVPDIPQLPPFFFRKPSSRSNRWSHKVPRTDALVGPVLPLPILMTLHELRNGCPNSEDEIGLFSPEMELSNRCNEVMQVAREMAMPDSTVELHDDDAVSLADDRDDIWVDLDKPRSLCLYRPVGVQCSTDDHQERNCVHKIDRFAFMMAKVHEKESTHKRGETMGQEFFNDLCPIHMKFDVAAMDCTLQEMKAYSLLKRHFSKWQEEFKPFQGFCNRFQKQGT
ncbi:uncharacterized protein LOC8263218 [Ricinus communis]|uniref:Uncharacterized protein n=1 Tax=Ricinus communis TaxID=3988 RepID=B9SWI9_RICCO|nr:uncharacterized protein LOC8263218 [Ricinus communis]XP_015581594.1 uncharacterized protein LOC8263218 [Ricinus communis]XP_015581595.1 uncharacterized protein LOC8263218 [Ricinus communis]XP_015581596.1 uncharacterized protein LOC8263218 [Ricinus communis]XP_015581597.1 uncharacterized protein LOC8263218 [Ricinus communis]EEF32019.1 conserved hypothetical protein [Ricinus communis]|eukprot:XP_002530358.1 uncharacterized protein LOC8263218 [Ricinus communis]